MIDNRHLTFLSLCEIGSYTKTAETLHLTQPAVSQHIKYIESLYNCKLFAYEGKKLVPTEKGKLLKEFLTTVSSDSIYLKKLISSKSPDKRHLSFGATLTIGEYVMPKILESLLKKDENITFTMEVENTATLLEKLEKGELNFIILEGFFNKAQLDYSLFSIEDFVPICQKGYFENRNIHRINDILQERILLREEGSGTREIFQQLLREHNYSIQSFPKLCHLGSMKSIISLVKQGEGISFLYKTAVEEEIKKGSLEIIPINDLNCQREFNFVYLKNSHHKTEYERWFKLFKKLRL